MKRAICAGAALLLLAAAACAQAEDGLVQTILNTGTTQAFTEEAVAEGDLNLIVQAGLSAASAINQQPWVFAVITNADVMAEIAGSSMPSGAPPTNAGEGAEAPDGENVAVADGEDAAATESQAPAGEDMSAPAASGTAKAALGDSPAAIVLYMDESTASPNASFDCGLACQNMVIAASALGYGTKIVSSPTIALNGDNHDALCETLGVDTSLQAVAVLLIGHADEQIDAQSSASTRATIEEKVSFVQ